MEPNEELIQNYFKNSLDVSSLEKMQQLLETDSVFKEEVEFYQNLKRGIYEFEREKLQQRLEAVESVSKKPLPRKALLFALISIAISLGIVFFLSNDRLDTQELYIQNFEPYLATLNELNSDIDSRDFLPFRAYEREAYEVAAEGFRTQLEAEAQPDLQFYYTMSLLNSGTNDAEALLQLRNLEKNNTKYQPQIYWYSGLLLLKNEEVADAKVQFQKLLDHPAKYKNREAVTILKKL
ncbi:hypothetical protein ACFQO1_08700 [Jejudonia soesokkakensis]|uniref:Tetratricopeptide repeat protein n=1 Tax=Jejudonia soesokkakensis TaxID=1323432 RepID=A0ABW2MS73_9FLAO